VRKLIGMTGLVVGAAFGLIGKGAAQSVSHPAEQALRACVIDKVSSQLADLSVARVKTDDEIASAAISQCHDLIDPAYDEGAPQTNAMSREEGRAIAVAVLKQEAKTLSQLSRPHPARPNKK